MFLARTAMAALITIALESVALAAGFDFEVYRTQVEPIFLKKRPGHARCAVCHEANSSAFRLAPRAPGAATWTEEQSRRNFENVTHLVTAGDPNTSRLLIHTLSPDAGGDDFHGGGRQFPSKQDPDWKTIADWVSQAK
ncbi:MAG: hypothetical protein ABSB15_13590 [Bryobacteraceae bacterium]|jgi:hypothetical protein